ncbi:unnamed protein product [Citrullus colocynthis]|uniref:Uncharacterized protein n=1 Tax=Citrullus colocynthis TaxID=252529 RepID=A0ABP0Z7Z2_9ROSI
MRKKETYEWKWREIEEAADGVFLFWDYEYLEAGRSRTEILSFKCLLHLLYEGEKEEALYWRGDGQILLALPPKPHVRYSL